MERREPTLSGAANEREESTYRRQSAAYDDGRQGREAPVYASAPSSSLPAIALAIALIGVGGAAFLGFQLMEARKIMEKDAARIAQLESQLNITSSESTQSVSALGINLQKVDVETKKLWEAAKKSNTEHNEKFASLGKGLENARAEIANLKNETNSLKQESLAHKATLDEVANHFDLLDKATAEQRKKLQDTSAGVNAIAAQVKSAEALAARITKTEEAIDAIDDNRRTINKDLLQIKQQLGIKN
jgi:DNA repair exonuclease SbcCD ATPase subunit